MSEEKRMILEMVKEGKITVEEAERLLEKAAPGESLHGPTQVAKPNSRKFLRIRVTEDGKHKANINIPIALAEVGLNLIPKDKLKVEGKEINMTQNLKLIEEGTGTSRSCLFTIPEKFVLVVVSQTISTKAQKISTEDY